MLLMRTSVFVILMESVNLYDAVSLDGNLHTVLDIVKEFVAEGVNNGH